MRRNAPRTCSQAVSPPSGNSTVDGMGVCAAFSTWSTLALARGGAAGSEPLKVVGSIVVRGIEQ